MSWSRREKVTSPTPAQIKTRAAEVREGWDEATLLKRCRRLNDEPIPWLPPLIRASEFLDITTEVNSDCS